MDAIDIQKNWKERWDVTYWYPGSPIYKFWMDKFPCPECGVDRTQACCYNGCSKKKKK